MYGYGSSSLLPPGDRFAPPIVQLKADSQPLPTQGGPQVQFGRHVWLGRQWVGRHWVGQPSRCVLSPLRPLPVASTPSVASSPVGAQLVWVCRLVWVSWASQAKLLVRFEFAAARTQERWRIARIRWYQGNRGPHMVLWAGVVLVVMMVTPEGAGPIREGQ